MFENKGLGIATECNPKIVNYLDVSLSLNDESYRPNKECIRETLYRCKSRPSPSSVKQLSVSIEKQ